MKISPSFVNFCNWLSMKCEEKKAIIPCLNNQWSTAFQPQLNKPPLPPSPPNGSRVGCKIDTLEFTIIMMVIVSHKQLTQMWLILTNEWTHKVLSFILRKPTSKILSISPYFYFLCCNSTSGIYEHRIWDNTALEEQNSWFINHLTGLFNTSVR